MMNGGRIVHRSTFTGIMAVLAFVVPVGAQETPQRGCDTAQHRQFDFWIGEWDVINRAGERAGRNRITAEMGGCVLREQWEGAGGLTGSSLNIYDAAAGRWHQTWVDSGGTLLLLDGALQSEGVMVLEGERPAAEGGTAKHRITWTRQGPDSVRQLWEVRGGDSPSWQIIFDGSYRRIE
jgi:hypothetical protein